MRLRVAAYETGYLKAKRLDAKVISIGNITLGGTGKTPLVEYVARYLKKEGHSVAILTRGYGRKSRGRRVLNHCPVEASGFRAVEEYGDEPLMLARALADIPVVIGSNRFENGAWAERQLGSEVLILDDGYQHLALARNLNILVIDATDTFGGFKMVPLGRLREPLYGLRRADAVVITRAHRPFDQAETLRVISSFCGSEVPIFYTYSEISELRHLETGMVYDARQFAGWDVAVMCGIGNPEAFADDLLQIGINIVSESFFGDHHPYTQGELDEVAEAARRAGADALVVTEKDAVRLEGLSYPDLPLYAARLELRGDDEVRLKSLLLRTIVAR